MRKYITGAKRWLSLGLAFFLLISNIPVQIFALDTANGDAVLTSYVPLYQEISVQPGQLVPETCTITESDVYGYVVGYELKKGHTLSISDTNYVFSVRELVDGNYSTMLKQATKDSFTATEDMTVGMLIRKPDKSALTAEELASVVICDSQYGMIGVDGYSHRFTVEAQTIDGGIHTTRANIFLPATYSETGEATKLIVMTNGYSAYLTDSAWNGNTADNVGIIQNYLDAGYAVWVVDNTAARTTQTPDLGCPQLVDSYFKAYEYIQEHFNVEEKFSIHSRSFGTFAAMRIMRERPELVKCAVMTGPRVSLEIAWGYVDKAFVANRFGFTDSTGASYEADKLVGYDPYTDVDGEVYALPPTYWVMCQGDETEEPMEVIEKLITHGNDVTTITHTGTDHTGVCTLNTEEMFSGALEFLNAHQTEKAPEPETLEGKTLSILGASISTFAGTSNGAAADTTNSTIRDNVKYYPHATVNDVTLNDTWWMQAANDLGLRLLVNNSWSGSSLLHERSGTVGAYVDRCVQLHDDTGDNAGEMPDIIGIQMGTNDFQYYKDTLGTADIDYDALITANGDGTYTYATPVTSLEAAAIVLHKISIRYPDAEVYYLNISQRVDGTDELIQSFNTELAKVVEHFGAHIVDIYGSAITMEDFDTYIGDGRVHPNKLGMDAYTEAFKASVLANTAYSVECHTVSLDLTDVQADYGTDKAVVDGDAFSIKLSATAGNALEVTVTMGGEDITDSAYADGSITIDAVTADVTITAKGVHDPQCYRWEFDGTDLASVGETENTLTQNAGSTTDGVFSATRYALENTVVLGHDQPWSVEWESEGTWKNSGTSSGGRLFSSTDVNAAYNARYIFKSVNSYLIAMGEKTATGSHNYGIALADHGIDGSEPHTYRLQNRIADDGSNMVYLYVDGVEIGAMNNYYVGTTDKETTSDWLSGKDFVFPYIGTDTHGLNNCSIEYIQIWEGGVSEEISEPMSMCYDDHLDMSGKTVEIIDAGTPTSYKVGYGVAEGTLDDVVVTLDGDTLVATGIGIATVRIDGRLYEVTVTAAPISLILLAGQSNMQGSEGDANQSIVCPDGMVYSTYGDRYTMTVNNATNYAPSALTGEGSTLNVNGTTTNLEDWPVYLLNEAGAGKAGPDSGFAYEWVQQTGEKVWIVNAAHGGSSITTWQDGGANYEEAILLFSACQETLRQEIAAGHYTLSHMGYFWCQGCTDYSRTAAWYVNKYLTMHENFKSELAFDADSDTATADVTFEFGGIIPVRAGHEYYTSYREGAPLYTTTAKYHESFMDLRFTGPRVAQYWMGNNPELTDIWIVCNIGEDWVTMPDGTDGVSEYFQSHYPNGTVDYTTQVAQASSWYTPTTPAAVHDSIHYNQIGYNEVGRESVRNALILLGELEAPEAETTVEFLTWDGVTSAEEVAAWTEGTSGSLVVPVVSPIWKAKEVTYGVTDGLTYSYYDLLADTAQTEGTLTAGTGERVSVVKQEPGAYFADHLSQLPEPLCCNVNLWAELEHDDQFYSGGTHWAVHSSGTVYSVTIPVEPGDMIFATAFGKGGENGHASSNGIRVTFFGEYDVVKTLAPADTYGEFAANGGYLIVPEGAVAVNIPMWTDDDSNELYILNLPHDQTEEICSICGEDSHSHVWSDWETVSKPAADALGVEERKCACGETETREVEGVWQKYALADHMQALPDAYCAGTNLWTAMEHDDQYFLSGSSWGKHSSGSVYSVTIPVEPGDKIFATSFGKAGENGTTQNGIRVTFFDAYGVLKTMAPSETYPEFSANGGYLIAPEGTVAVNVPMWNNSDENELYILNAEHTYSGVSCTSCGSEHPNAANYEGKVISVLGASICTFDGYIPVADGFNLEHVARYPQDNLLTDVNETWWMQVIHELDAKLGINDSWRSTEVYNACTDAVNSSYDGTKACLSSVTRIQNLGSNGTPDVILFFGGTNDITQRRPLGTFDPNTAPTQVDLTSQTWTTVVDAYTALIMRLQHYYPDSQIVVMLPYSTNSNSDTVTAEYTSVFAAICAHYGVTCIDMNDCGITTADLPDGTHPNAKGMDNITDAVLDTLLAESETEAGENVVYSVKHDLTNAAASLGYYKGISLGKTFTEILTGENLAVTVTMGGADITASCYADGEISIASVTGDLVITAKGTYNADDHLQQLPESFCAGTNLWTELAPENTYYTASGWGNNSNSNYSVTFPVAAGDRIWATSFGVAGENGYTMDGVRITWFSEDGVLDSMTRDRVYAEFAVNGYVTAPEGAVALNVPMASNADTWELYILSAEHDYKSVVTIPTCTERGYTTHTCTICGDSYVFDETAALGHAYDDGVVTTAPTCTAVGIQTFTCGTCGDSYTEEVAAVGHSYEAVVTAATCTEGGYTTYTCSACGDSYVSDEMEATRHTPNISAPTETEDQVCVACGTVLASKTGHICASNLTLYQANSASCTASGNIQYFACTCGKNYEDSAATKELASVTVPALGHSEETISAVAPTCTATGLTAGVKCGVCSEILTAQETVAALGHTEVTDAAVAATCQTTGLTEGKKCSECNETIIAQTVVPAVGHTEAVKAAVAPTCTATGLTEGKYCSVCGTTLESQKVVPALDHTEVAIPAVAPGCTTTGLTEGRQCSVCGVTTVEQTVVPATGHIWSNGTCGSCGTVCDHVYDEESGCVVCGGSCGHNYETVVTKSTCTTQGYTTYTCTLCGNAYNGDYVDALGHSWRAADCTAPKTCTTCGIAEGSPNSHNYDTVVTEPTRTEEGYTTHTCVTCGDSYVDGWIENLKMKADFNRDNIVDDADVAYLLWHTLFADNYPIDISGDLNGDGAVDDADVAYLLWHTLFPDTYPL